MSFRFSLSAVLRIRMLLEEREERMLQKTLAEITQTRQTLERIDAEIAGSNAARITDLFKSVIARRLHDSYGELKTLGQTRNEFQGQLNKLEQQRDLQLKAYEAARRNREMLSDMRQDRRNAYELDMARREQKILDDNYIARRGGS